MGANAKKKKYSLNVFDVFIIMLVLVLIASVVYRASATSTKEANQKKTVYTVYFECEEYESITKYLASGEAIYIQSTGELLGYICKSNDAVGNSMLAYVEEDTESEPSPEPPSSSDVVLYETARFEGKLKLNGNALKGRSGAYYSIEGFNISVGSVIEVYTDDTQFTITVKQILDKDGE